jgi:hypothetical protein
MIRIYDPEDRDADLFALANRETLLVSPVDCTGAQGAGLALAFKKRWPAACAWFKAEAQAGRVAPGTPRFYLGKDGPGLLFFPTKRHWKEPSTLEIVKAGLDALPETLRGVPRGIRRIGLPALGCGEGELDWADVRPLIESAAPQIVEAAFEAHIFPPQPWRDRAQVQRRRGA